MKQRYKQYILSTLGYFIGNVFSKLISFILLPLYTRLIEPEDYGIFGVNLTIIQLVSYVVYFSVWDSMFRFASDTESDDEKYKIISNALIIMGISTVICVLILLSINFFWSLHNPYLVCAYAVATAFQYYYGYIARSMHNNKVFIISGCINSFINLILNYISIACFHRGVEVLYYSYIIGTVVQVLMIELKFKTMYHFKVQYLKKTSLKMLLRFGMPLSVNSAAQWLLIGFTQMMIAYELGNYYNGLFSVAIKFATIISLIVSIFQFAWYELAYELAKEDKSELYYRKTINILFGILTLSASIVLLIIKLIYPYFIDEAYWGSLALIPYIVVYACTSAYAGFIGTIYMAYKDVNLITVSSLVAGIANIIGALVLIPNAKLTGAVVALMVASILMMLIRSKVLHKRHKISLDKRTLVCIISFLISCFVFRYVNSVRNEIIIGFLFICAWLIAVRNLFVRYLQKSE